MGICASQRSLSITENASDLHSYSHKLTYSHHIAKQSLIKTLLLTIKAIPVNSLFRTPIFLYGQTFKLWFQSIIYRYMTPLMKGSDYYRHASHNRTCQHANRKAVHCKVITKQEKIVLEGNIICIFLF